MIRYIKERNAYTPIIPSNAEGSRRTAARSKRVIVVRHNGAITSTAYSSISPLRSLTLTSVEMMGAVQQTHFGRNDEGIKPTSHTTAVHIINQGLLYEQAFLNYYLLSLIYSLSLHYSYHVIDTAHRCELAYSVERVHDGVFACFVR